MKKIQILFLASCFSFFLNADPIFRSVDQIPFDPVGYFAAEPCLDIIFRENEIKTVIEIGSWAGVSTRFFAHRVGEGGRVYAIDHWKGTPGNRAEQNDPRLSYIYHLFLSNAQYFELGDRIIPIRMDSEEAYKALTTLSADLIFIDASRDAERVYKDIINWYNNLSENGIICGTEWREPGVQKGVSRAASTLGMRVESDRKGVFWVLR